MYYLITYCEDYCDEHDIAGLCLLTREQWEKYKELAAKYFEDFGSGEFYFGTNEYQEFNSFEHWVKVHKAEPLTEREYVSLSRLIFNTLYEMQPFGGKSFGVHFVNDPAINYGEEDDGFTEEEVD